MRLFPLLLFAALSLAFAPAPLPKPDRETPQRKREREVAALARRLRELGVEWRVANGRGGRAVRSAVTVSLPNRNGSMHGDVPVAGGDLPRALRDVIRHAEIFLRGETDEDVLAP